MQVHVCECEVRGQPKVSSSALYLTRSGQGVSLHFTLTDWLNWASETQGSASLNSRRPTSVYCTPRFSRECWGLEFKAFRLNSKILSWAISLVPKGAYLLTQCCGRIDIYMRGLFPPLLLVSKLRSLGKQTTFSIQVQEPHPHPVCVCSMPSSSRFSLAGLDIYVQNFLILYKTSLYFTVYHRSHVLAISVSLETRRGTMHTWEPWQNTISTSAGEKMAKLTSEELLQSQMLQIRGWAPDALVRRQALRK